MDACWQCGALLSPLSLAAPSPDFSCVTCGARLADTPSLGLSEAIADQMMLYSGLACVTVPAWSDSVTDHGQEYVTELVSGSLRGANPMNAADRLYAVTLEAWRHRKAFARWKARRQRRGKTPQESAALRRRRAALITGWLGAGGQRDRREGAFLVQPDDCYAALNAETPAFAGTVAYAMSLIS